MAETAGSDCGAAKAGRESGGAGIAWLIRAGVGAREGSGVRLRFKEAEASCCMASCGVAEGGTRVADMVAGGTVLAGRVIRALAELGASIIEERRRFGRERSVIRSISGSRNVTSFEAGVVLRELPCWKEGVRGVVVLTPPKQRRVGRYSTTRRTASALPHKSRGCG